ncbi:MAG: NADP-dependent oxidoreductase [Reyranellaceae bacterium]
MTLQNTSIVLASRPQGDVRPENFRREDGPAAKPGDGQVLARIIYLSLDPYMRPRMTEMNSYTPPFELDKPLLGGAVAEIVESNSDRFRPGDIAMGMFGWQRYSVADARLLRKLDPAAAPLVAHLGVLGMPGYTAYHGMLRIGQPKEGETVFVSAATGAVGAMAGQLARLKGARVVGCASSDEKCDYAVKELGYDACFNHSKERDYDAVLKQLCPKGIDVDFENVGGPIFHAVFRAMNDFGRIAMCGAISEYNDTKPQPGPEKMFTIIQRRLEIKGFIISDHLQGMGEFVRDVGGWIKEGRIRYRETVVPGLERAPEAFMGLLKGSNFGKLVVKVGDEPGR